MRIIDWSSDVFSSDLTRAKVLKIDKNGTGFTVTYETPKETEVIDCDLVVHATGRVPNIDHLNLDAAGVEYSRRGIKVSPFMRTTNPAIFAAGDCADSGPNLTPVARSEEHTSELQSLMRISYAVFCLKKKKQNNRQDYRLLLRRQQTRQQ